MKHDMAEKHNIDLLLCVGNSARSVLWSIFPGAHTDQHFDGFGGVFKMTKKGHWNSTYRAKSDEEMSWTQLVPLISLMLIREVCSSG